MKLTILGSGTSIISKNRLAPGYLLELNSGESLLFDCGGTVAQQFANINFDYFNLDHILISHPHADHFGGLISLIHSIILKSMYNKVLNKKQRKKPLFLHGYTGLLKDYKLLRKMMAPEPIETFPVKAVEYKNQKVEYPGFILKTKLVSHAEKYYQQKCLGFRLEADNKTFMYSGDSKYCKQLINLASNADLALIDSSSSESGLGKTGYHLTPRGAGKIARQAEVKKLVLTHHYDIKPPRQILKQANQYFRGETVIAKDLMVVNI